MPEKLYNSKAECCGCEACVNVCPKNIIEMRSDSEGFLYPYVINSVECISCSNCLNVCPVKNSEDVVDFSERGIAGYSNSQSEIKRSASGGLATAIAKGFIKNTQGVVYGVSYTDDFMKVIYERASNIEQLEHFRTSKYVQSVKGDVYKCVKADLNSGHKVLFFGLPCDTYALQRYLGKDFENLFVCSLICHGPTSQAVHEQYINSIKSDDSVFLKSFSVRYKKDGWKPYYIKAVFNNGKEYVERFDNSTYGVAFQYLKRPSCNVCSIKRSRIHSDLTIGDYHLAASGKVKPYNQDGVSSGIIHSKKGDYLISIADDFYVEETTVKNVMYSEAYHKCIAAKKNRKKFGIIFSDKGLIEACNLRSVKRIEREAGIKRKILRICAKLKKRLLRK